MHHYSIDYYLSKHYIHRSNWLRASVLGANDGIISVSSLVIGVASASAAREAILLATVAGLVAGALSMAAGEYVSVSSQTDIEKADIERERRELQTAPDEEMKMLALIYKQRGLSEETAIQVARELTHHDALGAHVRDELGITEMTQANPMQAALASGGAFVAGGLLPLLVAFLAPVGGMEYWLYLFSIPSSSPARYCICSYWRGERPQSSHSSDDSRILSYGTVRISWLYLRSERIAVEPSSIILE